MRKLTILVVSVNAVGHVNACAGALTALLSRGHRVIFVQEKAFEGKLSARGYEEFIWTRPPLIESPNSDEQKTSSSQSSVNPGEKIAKYLLANKVIGPYSPLEKLETISKYYANPKFHFEVKNWDAATKQAIGLYKPDVIYVDGVLLPAIYWSGVPWIWNISNTPQYFIKSPEIPPGGSGLPTNDSTNWTPYAALQAQMKYSTDYGDLIQEMGYERYPNDQRIPETQILTVIAYPEELNYPEARAKGWFNLEVFTKNSTSNRAVKLSKFVPEDFLADNLGGKFSGKLIYLSLGSMGSVDLDLMNRMVKALAKTDHKCIVSMGPRYEELDLAKNMWGSRYLPQPSILPHVDLVITHGGNNTTTETFAEGKPMIVLPLYGDQFDNAQRIHETGFGARIDPYNFTENELISAVDKLLNDFGLKSRLQVAFERIQGLNRHEELAVKIEELIGNNL